MIGSFRLKLALIMTFVPSVVVSAFGAVAWWTLQRQLLDKLDLQMTLPGNTLAKQVLPETDIAKFQEWSRTFLDQVAPEGDFLSWTLVMKNRSREVISASEDGLAESLPFEIYLPRKDEFVQLPQRIQPSAGGRSRDRLPPLRGDRDRRRSPGVDEGLRDGEERDHRGPPDRRGRDERAMYRPPLFFSAISGESHWRVGVFSNPYASVFIGVDLKFFEADVRRLRLRYMLAVGGGIVLTAMAGWMMASKAMRPVHRIAQTAEQMTAMGLDRRIPITGREDREFASLINVLNAMMGRLEDSFLHAARFSADASHELKTPLAVMRGELERGLKQCEPGSEQEQRFIDLSEEVHRLNQITEALLTLSRADSGSLKLEKENFSLEAALEGFCEDAEILCYEEGLAFHAEIAPHLSIVADRAVMLSVLHNLMSNAIKYNQPKGLVTIRAFEEGEWVRIEVANTGPGIPESQRERVFKRFYRLDDARSRRTDGFGLGLNIAIELSRANGGELRLEDAEEDGMTRFTLSFPKATA